MAIIRDGTEYDELTGHGEAEVVLDQTPFYAEGGGQVGDRGVIPEPGGGSTALHGDDTQRPSGGLVVHHGSCTGGCGSGRASRPRSMPSAAPARCATTRARTCCTAPCATRRRRRQQAGSLVAPDYLRFDYPFDRGLTADEKLRIEHEVRRVIREDRPVTPSCAMAEAIEAGADAFFDEKYGETVRTVRVEGYSHELCGGTHCRATGQIGGFIITGERSIGSGMRRIEAVTGEAAEASCRGALLARAAPTAVGAQTAEQLDRRRFEELRETRRRPARGRRPRADGPDLAPRRRGALPRGRLVALRRRLPSPWTS